MTSCPTCGAEVPESPLADALMEGGVMARTVAEAEELGIGLMTQRCKACGTLMNAYGERVDISEGPTAELDARLKGREGRN
jgi:hypothetical protein